MSVPRSARRWDSTRAADYGEMLRPHLGDEAALGIAGIYAAAQENPTPPPLVPGAIVVQGETALRDWARRRLAAVRAA